MVEKFKVKRLTDPPEADDGLRVLVDRLWPRGLKKAGAPFDLWLKEVAPSHALRKSFAHDVPRWDEFQVAYGAELDAQPEIVDHLEGLAAAGPVTLLYSARDRDHNQAVALLGYLTRRRR